MIMFYGMFRQKLDGIRMMGASASTFSTTLYGEL